MMGDSLFSLEGKTALITGVGTGAWFCISQRSGKGGCGCGSEQQEQG